MNGDQNLCKGCFHKLEGERSCPCGYDPDAPDPPSGLPVGTQVGHYQLGKVVKVNGEGILYMGYDGERDEKVWVREFFPSALALRKGRTVTPREGKELPFKSLLSDFSDLLKAVGKLTENGHILPVENVLSENGTVYGIYPDRELCSLESYLLSSGGRLSWNEAKHVILQLGSALSAVHQQGMIHGGVSPETVFLDQNGEVYLTSFATTALRTDRTEIDEELFPGYSAPEQYSLSSWQGAWTDVYGTGALLYRMLLGYASPDSISRRISDKLDCPAQLHQTVPTGVCAAIDRALRLSPEQRYQSVDEFTAALLKASGSAGTMVFDAARLPAPREGEGETMAFRPVDTPGGTSPQGTRGRKSAFPIKLICGILLGCTLLAGMVAVVMFPENMPWAKPPAQERVPLPAPNYVPSLVGMHINAVTSNRDITDKFVISQQEEFDEEYPAGIVIRQAPDPGVKMINKGIIILTVSKGSVKVQMPNLVGGNLEFALQTLATMEIPYQVVESDEYEPGIVGKTSIGEGQWVNKLNDRVTIYVGVQPESDTGESSSSSESSSSPSDGISIYTRPDPDPVLTPDFPQGE